MKSICLIIGMSWLLIGCNYKKADQPAPAENTIKVGEKFYIPLPENHTTGYMWQLSQEYDTKTLDYIGSVFHGNEKGVYFNFMGLKPGKTTLNFTLIKYQDSTDVKSFIIDVQ